MTEEPKCASHSKNVLSSKIFDQPRTPLVAVVYKFFVQFSQVQLLVHYSCSNSVLSDHRICNSESSCKSLLVDLCPPEKNPDSFLRNYSCGVVFTKCKVSKFHRRTGTCTWYFQRNGSH
jgi:hypothetical protein